MKIKNINKKQGKQNNLIGKKFENYVSNIFLDLGKQNIKKNIIIKKNKCFSEFDIVYGYINKKYVECKFKSREYVVTTEEVCVFAKKLDLHNINNSSGIIITNKYLSNKAKEICKKSRIKIIERNTLNKLDYERMNLINSLKYKLSKHPPTLEQRIFQTSYKNLIHKY